MKILVISDLHAVSQGRENGIAPSLITFSGSKRSATSDPLIGLRDLLKSGGVDRPDVLICAGDMADKADPLALTQVWAELNDIRNENNIPNLMATCGNHDLDSRYTANKYDPQGFLKSLEPSFPNPNWGKWDVSHLGYWAHNFYITEMDGWRILNINSCAYHGYGTETSPELVHGRISDYTIDTIKNALSLNIEKKRNICIFHHHVKDTSNDNFEDKSSIRGINNLISILSDAKYGEWFIIHGHRHMSDLFYSTGGNSNPIVLSCASFSASRTEIQNPSPNQFYLIDFDTTSVGPVPRVRGTIKAWNWTPGSGWQSHSSIPGGLPCETGFGFRGEISGLAQKIIEEVEIKKRLTWNEILATFKELQYFIPTDLVALENILDGVNDVVVSGKVGSGGIKEIVSRQ